MTRAERAILVTAIRHLNADDGFDAGMTLLCRLAKIETPRADLIGKGEGSAPAWDLMKGRNRKFRYKLPQQRKVVNR